MCRLIRSTISWPCGLWSIRSPTVITLWALSIPCGRRCRTVSTTISPTPNQTCIGRFIPRSWARRGKMIEIQIRTHAMHYTAEYGIAAHWLYKEGKKGPGELDRQMAWLREILEWQREMTNPEEFMEYLKVDLFQEDIFVYTPAGELKQLSARLDRPRFRLRRPFGCWFPLCRGQGQQQIRAPFHQARKRRRN